MSNRAQVGLQNRVRTPACRPVQLIVCFLLCGIFYSSTRQLSSVYARSLTESGTDKVETTALPYAAPEVLSSITDRIVTLDASMDVWSMAIVILQAITRRTMGPTEGNVNMNGAHGSLDDSSKHV